MDTALLGTGAAAPSLRVPAEEIAAAWDDRARGTVAACAADEDPLTLAWQAATRALDAAGTTPEAVDGLWWGVTRPPFAEGPNLAFLASALRLRSDLAVGGVLSGSPHVGAEALQAAATAVAAGQVSRALVVASDALLPARGSSFEQRAGAGAVSFVVAADGPARVTAQVARLRPHLDRYRGDREEATRDVYDGRLFRETVFLPTVTELTGELGDDIERWSLPDPDGRLGRTLARRLHLDADAMPSAGVYEALGDAGAATPLLGLATALDRPGTAGVIAQGGGRFTGLKVEAAEALPGADAVPAALAGGQSASYPGLLRARGQLRPDGESIEMGVPPAGAGFQRGTDEMLRLTGGKCSDCGAIATPLSVHPHCLDCGGDKLVEVPLARTGEVQTFVVNETMPDPFVAPLPMVVVDLDDGARVMLQGGGDGGDLEIGSRVRLALRRYTVERGAPVYGYKVLTETQERT